MAKQWTPDDILEMAWSFQSACIITAAAELDLFTALDRRPADAESLASELNTDPRATTILLDALVAAELLTKQNGNYSVPADLAELLSESSPKNILPMARHLANLLPRWAQLPRITQTGVPPERTPGIRGEAADNAAFIDAMHTFSAPVAAEVVGRIKPLRFNHLLDVGGASGTWTIAFLKAVPEAKATIFDLPNVIPMARKRLTEAGFVDRVTLVEGDFYQDDLPAGVDLVFLGAIAHQNSRQQNRELFAKVNAALEKNGAVVIRDVVMAPSHTTPRLGALFAVNMLVATPKGGTYSFEEYTEDLTAAGFADPTLLHQDEFMNSLIRAVKK